MVTDESNRVDTVSLALQDRISSVHGHGSIPPTQSAEAAAECRRKAVAIASAGVVAVAALLLAGVQVSRADNFRQLSYDAKTDELVVVIDYRGTNPDHEFDVKWDPCQTHDDGSNEVAGELLDRQARDAARQDYTKTLRFSVAELQCRPATLTLRTAPRFYATVRLPARSGSNRG